MLRSWCLLFATVAVVFIIVTSASETTTETSTNATTQTENCTEKLIQELYQPNGPQIIPCKKDLILQDGYNYTLICRAKYPIDFIQQKVPEENLGKFKAEARYVINETDEYKYKIYLDLINVDRIAIGYYACIPKNNTLEERKLNELTIEPNNTDVSSYIYIYVNGTDSLFAPMREIVVGKKDFYIVECKPTTPDVEINIYTDIAENTPFIRYSPKLGFVYDSDTLDALTELVTIFTCGFRREHITVDKELVFMKLQKELPTPIAYVAHEEFMEGETFSLNCSAKYVGNLALLLDWSLPDTVDKGMVEHENNTKSIDGQEVLYHNITIKNANKNHAGTYTCFVVNSCEKKMVSVIKTFLGGPMLDVKVGGFSKPPNPIVLKVKLKVQTLNLLIKSYPPANISLYKDTNIPLRNSTQYNIGDPKNFGDGYLSYMIRIHKNGVEDSSNYTAKIDNGHISKNVTFDIRFETSPKILTNITEKYCNFNQIVSLPCEVTGSPLPDITWTTGNNMTQMKSSLLDIIHPVYKEKAYLNVSCNNDKTIFCVASIKDEKANRIISVKNHSISLRVDELPDGFGINDTKNAGWYPESENVTLICLGSKHKFSNVTWKLNEINESMKVEHNVNDFSLVAKLKFTRISMNDAGIYVCNGNRFNGTTQTEEIHVKVEHRTEPKIKLETSFEGQVQNFQSISMFCEAHGIPKPVITWFKDGYDFTPESNVNITYDNDVDHMTVSSTINIYQMNEKNAGIYACVARNDKDETKTMAELVLKKVVIMPYIITAVVIFIALIAVVAFLIIKLRKDKAKRRQLRRELAAAGLLYFNEGQSKYLNPDLGIDEQADLLPYDEKFEFPPEKLVLGKQLGAGAFGVVYKAEARGIINAEETTPVAVKKVKATADSMYIKALATELKIMVHLGKHVNIVNLLGACTKNVGKRELSVIVEYCKFGNIHNYMQKHREVFIDLFSDNNKEKTFGKVNRGYDSSGSTGVQSDYGTANTQDTDHTFLTNNTNRTSRKNVCSQPPEVAKASESYVQPEWRSNYESDYSYDGRSPRPLTSRDLLCWAFQIARGMEYLASRRILHGDLAARNILLAEDNVVKICDFGLARSIYKNDEYQKKENSLLPVKWLAIECMTDRVFSTQSDVWSFGIVLWELFTLAKTPYPNMDPHHLLPFLREGHRLEKPPYADDRIYELMKRCWDEKPKVRPSFTRLQEDLGNLLEENVRNHYVDLNNEYMEFNAMRDGQEDYLAMVSAPDYNIMVTPSPHHYVNEVSEPRRFFPPTPTKVDEDGYLQVSPRHNDIFSPNPKTTTTRFDFEPRKLNPRPSEASSVGSELTPMLTLNNLPRSGSDSDHEGNTFPYPNGCPTIDEETVDDVFLSKLNKETSQLNAKNAQNTAVSNPTYISLDLDLQKKPKDNMISYVNLPNGLVK